MSCVAKRFSPLCVSYLNVKAAVAKIASEPKMSTERWKKRRKEKESSGRRRLPRLESIFSAAEKSRLFTKVNGDRVEQEGGKKCRESS